jgi:hypothetical protein
MSCYMVCHVTQPGKTKTQGYGNRHKRTDIVWQVGEAFPEESVIFMESERKRWVIFQAKRAKAWVWRTEDTFKKQRKAGC